MEIFLLFAVFYLPSYAFPASVASGAAFDDPLFHLRYLFLALPQILLTLYLVVDGSGAARFGLLSPGRRGFAWILALTAGLFAIGLGASTASEAIAAQPSSGIGILTLPRMVPFALLTCALTGYREELFFRAFMIVKMEDGDVPAWAVYAVTSALFGLGHAYQGAIGFLSASCMGLCLAYAFRRTRNLHVCAVSHAIYDSGIVLIGLCLAR
jgi:uncharacterized protein